MPWFPRTEAEMNALAESMAAGFRDHPEIFVHADPAALETALAAFHARTAEQAAAQAHAKQATQAKKDAQRRLTSLMNAQFKLSEVDTGHQTSLLHLIGWAAKAGPKRGLPPGQPRTLRAVLEDGGTLALDWKSPVPGEGHGRVRAYLVERREQPAPNAPLTEWTQIAVALETSITLTRQPRAQQLEFRVVPVNNGGIGTPSNTASVVL